jgi:hypothetical protein
MSRDAADLARSAAQIVQERGLSKKYLQGQGGSVCMYGALNAAQAHGLACLTLHSPVTWEVRHALHRVLGLEGVSPLDPFPGAVSFNDDPDTTATDVAKVLLKVADELELA